jgi:hypothetical protein
MLEFLRLLVRLRWPMRLASPIFGRFHPYRPSYALDLYPTYRRLREEAPVYFHPVFRAWILSRYDDVSTALKSPDVSVRRGAGNLPDFLNPFKGEIRSPLRGDGRWCCAAHSRFRSGSRLPTRISSAGGRGPSKAGSPSSRGAPATQPREVTRAGQGRARDRAVSPGFRRGRLRACSSP